MAYNTHTYGIVDQVAQKIHAEQKPTREKANTVVVAIGTIIAAILAGLTYLIEAGVDWVPEWTPTVVTLLTMVATMLGVSRTKNGITKSVLAQINAAISDLIDQRAEVSPPMSGMPTPMVPTTEPSPSHRGRGESIADDLDQLARRYAERR